MTSHPSTQGRCRRPAGLKRCSEHNWGGFGEAIYEVRMRMAREFDAYMRSGAQPNDTCTAGGLALVADVIDSTGTRILASLHHMALRAGGRLSLCEPSRRMLSVVATTILATHDVLTIDALEPRIEVEPQRRSGLQIRRAGVRGDLVVQRWRACRHGPPQMTNSHAKTQNVVEIARQSGGVTSRRTRSSGQLRCYFQTAPSVRDCRP
jgi:hypothetical protein